MVNRTTLRWSLLLMGVLVLVSYAVGIARMNHDALELWGGLKTDSGYLYVLPFMALAVAGFCLYWWTALVTMDEANMNKLRWPWTVDDDSKGATRLLASLCVFLLPSALWLEATLFHMDHGTTWSPILPIGVLVVVALGNLMFGALAADAYKNRLPGWKRMLVGALLLGVQCILNDCIVWNAMFPWGDYMTHSNRTSNITMAN